ncbi:MAG: hypothetical protein CEN88_241, partial [Candidatus Berkelbacteria bacterium Licking1014_2]
MLNRFIAYGLLVVLLLSFVVGGKWKGTKAAYEVGQNQVLCVGLDEDVAKSCSGESCEGRDITVKNGGKLIADGSHIFGDLFVENGGEVTHSPLNKDKQPTGFDAYEYWGIAWDGWFYVQTANQDYFFFIDSDDGHRLYIDRTADSDGSAIIDERDFDVGGDQRKPVNNSKYTAASCTENPSGSGRYYCTYNLPQRNTLGTQAMVGSTYGTGGDIYQVRFDSVGLYKIRIKYYDWGGYAGFAMLHSIGMGPNFQYASTINKGIQYSRFDSSANTANGDGLMASFYDFTGEPAFGTDDSKPFQSKYLRLKAITKSLFISYTSYTNPIRTPDFNFSNGNPWYVANTSASQPNPGSFFGRAAELNNGGLNLTVNNLYISNGGKINVSKKGLYWYSGLP